MELRAELLKSIWYAFTALDVEKSGKVSKSQLKVLSHNLYTVLRIPHDPVALEEHFRDDDDGPVSSQGYMPYLNKYILDKVEEGAFVKETFDELCWTLTAKKNYKPDRNGNSVVFFKLWCLFSFLSEDKYPLVMVPDEVEYLLKKICTAMNVELHSCELDECLAQEPPGPGGLTVWQFLDVVNSGRVLRGLEREAVSMAVEEVYQEIIEDVLKQGYLWKKGQLRRTWSERWFTLKPSALSYYMSEERKEKKGSIPLDKHCCVEVLPDRDGKRCMFCVKTSSRTYEMSASDTRQRQEWTLAIQTAIRLQAEGKKSLHKDLKQKRREQREQREQRKAAKEEETQRLKQLQEEKERKLQELELLKELLAEEEEKLKQLMKLKEEQEEYIIKTQMEKQVLKQEMENKNKCLEEAQKQLEEVRVNRQRVDQDVMAAQHKLRQASTNVKHWNVQMNRLMHPIEPGDKRVNASGGGFAGYQPLLSRRDSSLRLKQKAEDKGSAAGDEGSEPGSGGAAQPDN
ncbi:PREDICTED: differentially expressed in FDCP 6 homolog [Tinamus guttatus]|uniref:differentially expressed in FDCP 6 homolog n=1 Tax=Tinamus guttatus TaxID=94827 RepID=UPI00052E6E48|nr:PREDICTED: differentially expressed in FDCP 6 homolog [Tinamus guttatus]